MRIGGKGVPDVRFDPCHLPMMSEVKIVLVPTNVQCDVFGGFARFLIQVQTVPF